MGNNPRWKNNVFFLALVISIISSIIILTSLQISTEENYNIPSWVKNPAGWWATGQIGDSDFTSGIQYILQNGIMTISANATTINVTSSSVIPVWVKNNAGRWANGTASDGDFVSGIQYLVGAGIINLNSTSNVPPTCDKSLWDHIYHPNRLQVVEDCKTVTGTIDHIIVEKDGDSHIRLKLDPQYANLINDANISGQHGDLVVEPICQNPVTQQDAIDACAGFDYHVDIPPEGTHVSVIGSYVLDNDHGGWAEIHPVTSIVVIP